MAPDGYLRAALADGTRAFRYRAGVRELLGMPPDTGVHVRFAAAARRSDFSYLYRYGEQPTQVPVGIQRWLQLAAADDPVETPTATGPTKPRSATGDEPVIGVAEPVNPQLPAHPPTDVAPSNVFVVPGITPRPSTSWSAPESGRIEADSRPERFQEPAGELSAPAPTVRDGHPTPLPSSTPPAPETPEPVSAPTALKQTSPTAPPIRSADVSTLYDERPVQPMAALDPQPASDRVYSRAGRPAAGEPAPPPAADLAPVTPSVAPPFAARKAPYPPKLPTPPSPAPRRPALVPTDEPTAEAPVGVRTPSRPATKRSTMAAVEHVAESAPTAAPPAAPPVPAIPPQYSQPEPAPRTGTPLFWERRNLTRPRTWNLR